ESTGKENGLEINSEVDERYHIEKATDAACRYFQTAYLKYGSWINAAASYNAGMTKISSALNNQQVNSALDLLVTSETSRYIFRILAIKQLFENPYLYGFVLKKEDLYPSIPVQRITVSETIDDIAAFSQNYGLNYMLLKEFNPWLRDNKLTVQPGKTYEIAIPRKEDLYFDKNAIRVYNEKWLSSR
ncbi:MAG: transglycosylase SLT domain-containing protein, partial [Candidatus Azobacteroides sp.]|nr:transglycosylase SLT domain-containing protein [Candidatus Azobacteroides sp.]